MRRLHLSPLPVLAAALLAPTASSQISLQGAVGFAAGAQPDSSALVDLDGDGDLDLAVPTDAPDKVSLLFNAGGGAFGAPVQVLLAGGSGPHGIVAGDLDGDGDVDLAVSLQNANAVRLIVNTGGTFSAGAQFGVGLNPRSLALDDLDRDGDWDLVVSNRDSNDVTVLRNNGNLAFTTATVAVGNDPREVATGDVTGDGLPDIAVAVHDDNVVRVLRNNGNASFSSFATLALGQLRPSGIDVGDLNGDGLRDIAASTSNNNVEFASVFLNQGGGAFGGAANYALVGLDASSLVLSDLDLDGRLDIATANTDSDNVSTLRNQGNGTFAALNLWSVGGQPGHVVAGDLDGNGSPDLVTANDASGNVSVLKNNAAGQPCAVSTYCTSKVNSQGSAAQAHGVGVPSFGAKGFSVRMTGAVPGNFTIAFYSEAGPAAVPFLNGFLCVQSPTTRLGPQVISAAGTASYAVPIPSTLAGGQRWYQFWYRDPAHPDGTGASLSNGLQVSFCH